MEDNIKHIVYKFLDETDFVRNDILTRMYGYECYSLCNQYVFRYAFDSVGKVMSVYIGMYVIDYIRKFIPIEYNDMCPIIENWIKDKYKR